MALKSGLTMLSVRKALLVPVVALMVTWLALSTPISCHHGATMLFETLRHSHVHNSSSSGQPAIIILPARMAGFLAFLNLVSRNSASNRESGVSQAVSSPETADSHLSLRVIPDCALSAPTLLLAWPVTLAEPLSFSGPRLIAVIRQFPDPPPRHFA